MGDAPFRRLLEDPTDLAAVRVWGDALLAEENPQGEAIQLACELESMALAAPKRRAIERRLAELVEQHGRVWCAAARARIPPRSQPYSHALEIGLVRGVAGHLQGPGEKVAAVLDRMAEVAPISALTPYLDVGALAKIAACSAFARIGRLYLSYSATDEYQTVFESATTPALEVLEVTYARATLLHSLARCSRLDRMTRLAIRGDASITTELLAPVLGEIGGRLESLELAGCPLGAAGVALIVDTCPRLRELSIEECAIDATAAKALAQAAWPKLERLAIGGNPLKGDGIVAIVSAKSLAKITHLSLRRRANTPAFDAKQLARMLDKLALSKLVSLELDGCLIRAAGATALVAGKQLPKLERLSLRGAGLGVDGAAALAKGTWKALRWVALDGNQMTTPGLTALAGAPWLETVEHLSLVDNNFKTGGGKALAAANLRALRVLELGNNWLGSQGVEALLENRQIAATLEDIHTQPGTGNNYGAAIVNAFVASDVLTLRSLDCHGATAEELDALWSSPRAASLRRMIVPMIVDVAAASRLAASPYLDQLGTLEIRGMLTPEATAVLANRFGPRLVTL